MEKNTTQMLQPRSSTFLMEMICWSQWKMLKQLSDCCMTFIRMCASGGFKLTKIIINKVEVLQSVTKTKKRKGVKNVDLNNRIDLPTEKHLE